MGSSSVSEAGNSAGLDAVGYYMLVAMAHVQAAAEVVEDVAAEVVRSLRCMEAARLGVLVGGRGSFAILGSSLELPFMRRRSRRVSVAQVYLCLCIAADLFLVSADVYVI